MQARHARSAFAAHCPAGPLAAITFCLTACGAASSNDDTNRVEVTDSAGVQLVRNLDPTADLAGVELVEDLRIGVLDGAEEYQFFRVTGVAVDADGRIFVADAGDHAVRIYDQDGTFVRGFGRPGQGPGEFTMPSGLFVRHDTVHVADRGGSGFTSVLFDTTGALLTTFSNLLPNGSRVTPLGASDAGWLVSDDSLFSRQQRERAGDVIRNPSTIARIVAADLPAATASRAAADSLLVPVITYLGARIFYSLGSEGGSEQFPLGNYPFFEPTPARAVDGRGFVHIARGWPYVIDTYDADGALVRRMTRAHDSIPVDDALMGEVMRRARAHYDTLTQVRGASMRTYENRAGYPRIGFVPVTSTIQASDDGWLWVRRPDLEPDPVALAFSIGLPPRPSYWDVFDRDGVLRHTVELPPRFALRAVTAESIVGVMRDELDVQYVVRFGFRPRS
jgi:hypothetical protein